jgi:transposase
MANRLKMAKLETILTLHRQGWSARQIAQTLGVHRDTVSRHLRESKQARAPTGSGEAKPATPAEGTPGFKLGQAPTGSGDSQESKQAGAPTGSDESISAEPTSQLEASAAASPHRQASLCEPFRAIILAKLEQGLTAQRIYQDLVCEYGFAGKYPSVKRFVRRLGTNTVLPFRRMECGPGEEAQVDFGTGIPILLPEGKRRRTHVFRIVLSHSRKGYSEAVYRQTTDEFVRCLENAFAHFGGVPKVLVLDNFKAAVLHADWFDPELNPKLRLFAQHYGLAILPTRPATPRHKGKIEKGVGYVKGNALKGHTFTTLEEENQHLLTWETTIADTRIHGTTRQQVGKMFLEVERPALQPLPRERFPFFHEGQRVVHRDGHIEVARAYYSVPPEYVGRQVWVRWDGRLIHIFNQHMEAIITHVRQEPGRFSTKPQHIASEKINSVERGAAWLLGKVRNIGCEAARWAEAVIQTRGVEGVRVLQGLLHLAQKHACSSLERACEIAHSHGAYRLRSVRALIEREAPKQESFLDEHPLIRSLTDYQQLVHRAFQKEAQS